MGIRRCHCHSLLSVVITMSGEKFSLIDVIVHVENGMQRLEVSMV